MPFARQAAARSATLATTFCSFACCGEPDSANAPPSMITSFCRSWISMAVRDGSSVTSPASVSSDIASSYRMYGSRRGPTFVRIV